LAERYFGEIPRGPVPPPVQAGIPVTGERSLLLEDRVELPRLYLGWHSPAMFDPGDADLDLAADVLAQGKTSRLYKRLVYDRRVAADVAAYQHPRELSGLFQVACTAAAGVSLPVLEAAIGEVLDEFAAEGPSEDELARAQAQTEAQFVYRLQSVGGFGGKSDQLNAYNVFQGNPGFFNDDLQRYRSVTQASLAAAVRQWLVGRPRVSLSLVPRGQPQLALAGATVVAVS
jgi:zinc protease